VTDTFERLFIELWVSFASLLRSYTAAHGLNRNRQATVELGEERITVRYGDRWLDLQRSVAQVRWRLEDGRNGVLELTETGRLRTSGGPSGEEVEMDLAAEQWARELMQ
jgi:hypothetical protein